MFEHTIKNGNCMFECILEVEKGVRLPIGEFIQVQIPSQYRTSVLRTVVLAHRKDQDNKADNVRWVRDRDPIPAYTSVEVRVAGTGKWIGYTDDFGNGLAADLNNKMRQPGKFAEPRKANDPEVEGLHDWQTQDVGPQCYDMIRISSVGKTPSMIHWFSIHFYPEGTPGETIEKIFTPGTKFGDFPSVGAATNGSRVLEGPEMGGGELITKDKAKKDKWLAMIRNQGLYPRAMVLQKRHNIYEFLGRNGREKFQNCLRIPVPPGFNDVYVEIACGDTYLDRKRPLEHQKDKLGFYGDRRGSRLYAQTKNSRAWVMSDENVPPSGVLAARASGLTEPGEEIVVWSRRDTTYIMGYRLVALKSSSMSWKKSLAKPTSQKKSVFSTLQSFFTSTHPANEPADPAKEPSQRSSSMPAKHFGGARASHRNRAPQKTRRAGSVKFGRGRRR